MRKSFLENGEYVRDLEVISETGLLEKLDGARVMVSGATGMIGKMLIDALMRRGKAKVIAIGRSEEKARARFPEFFESFEFVETDVADGVEYAGEVDYVLHLASATHPRQYATEPVGTILANITGLNNLLKLATKAQTKRFLFASSVEVYGENRGDAERFTEEYNGYTNCNTLRAGYPESKRAGEALCQAYRAQEGIEVVIPRLARVFGPTMLPGDSKASSQFIMNAVKEEDIVLKSEGLQAFSYLYVRDAVIGILMCLLCGKDGEAYNVADEKYDTTLKGLAEMLAEIAGKKVKFEQPDETERKGFSKATKALMDASKIRTLGFKVQGMMQEDLARTVKILRDLEV